MSLLASPLLPSLRSAAVARLRATGSVFAEDEADLLLAAAGTPAALDAMVERRAAGLPLELVLGWAEFCGLRVAVAPGVFVPRRRTEFLARQAIALATAARTTVPEALRPVVVDLCCGSGAVGAALAAAVSAPGVELYAADIDPAAVRCARRNIPGTVGEVSQGDLYEALPAAVRGRIDVLVANVPYVPTQQVGLLPPEARDHEPLVALDGGADGLDILRRVTAAAPQWLAPGGHLLVETSERQAASAAEVFRRSGLTPRVVTSEEEYATVVIGSVGSSESTVPAPGRSGPRG
ncbi:putative protein N(5)-glutamine methyltransferase [Streptomyces ochraceiscleroticus]|uniref:peptide chain release factor N(5)-glutamine methyltransferase n=1 Tax=Streptomyces ochraceiscleroticus TaxID=47761 RepID=A0ABW1MID9_9ACTN|nr:putative protein N(5)-glutamine methyltransferase [Streptomyces ochraceiscleroticus]